MLLRLKLAKYSCIGALFGTVLHFLSHGWVMSEQYLFAMFSQTQEAMVADLAVAFGYERPKPQMTDLDAHELVEREALRHGINPALARALMKAESNGKRFAVSKAGALGLMQVMPFNAKRCGLEHYGELFDPEKNIACGVKILAEELKTHGHDPVKALQAYNGGARCIGKCKESINHAKTVLTLVAKDVR